MSMARIPPDIKSEFLKVGPRHLHGFKTPQVIQAGIVNSYNLS